MYELLTSQITPLINLIFTREMYMYRTQVCIDIRKPHDAYMYSFIEIYRISIIQHLQCQIRQHCQEYCYEKFH